VILVYENIYGFRIGQVRHSNTLMRVVYLREGGVAGSGLARGR
jgi:hypothetical protein